MHTRINAKELRSAGLKCKRKQWGVIKSFFNGYHKLSWRRDYFYGLPQGVARAIDLKTIAGAMNKSIRLDRLRDVRSVNEFMYSIAYDGKILGLKLCVCLPHARKVNRKPNPYGYRVNTAIVWYPGTSGYNSNPLMQITGIMMGSRLKGFFKRAASLVPLGWME